MWMLRAQSIGLSEGQHAWVNEDWTKPRWGVVHGVAQPETKIAALIIHEAERSVPVGCKRARGVFTFGPDFWKYFVISRSFQDFFCFFYLLHQRNDATLFSQPF